MNLHPPLQEPIDDLVSIANKASMLNSPAKGVIVQQKKKKRKVASTIPVSAASGSRSNLVINSVFSLSEPCPMSEQIPAETLCPLPLSSERTVSTGAADTASSSVDLMKNNAAHCLLKTLLNGPPKPFRSSKKEDMITAAEINLDDEDADDCMVVKVDLSQKKPFFAHFINNKEVIVVDSDEEGKSPAKKPCEIGQKSPKRSADNHCMEDSLVTMEISPLKLNYSIVVKTSLDQEKKLNDGTGEMKNEPYDEVIVSKGSVSPTRQTQNFPCNLCSLVFTTRSTIVNHMLTDHVSKSASSPSNQKSDTDQICNLSKDSQAQDMSIIIQDAPYLVKKNTSTSPPPAPSETSTTLAKPVIPTPSPKAVNPDPCTSEANSVLVNRSSTTVDDTSITNSDSLAPPLCVRCECCCQWFSNYSRLQQHLCLNPKCKEYNDDLYKSSYPSAHVSKTSSKRNRKIHSTCICKRKFATVAMIKKHLSLTPKCANLYKIELSKKRKQNGTNKSGKSSEVSVASENTNKACAVRASFACGSCLTSFETQASLDKHQESKCTLADTLLKPQQKNLQVYSSGHPDAVAQVNKACSSTSKAQVAKKSTTLLNVHQKSLQVCSLGHLEETVVQVNKASNSKSKVKLPSALVSSELKNTVAAKTWKVPSSSLLTHQEPSITIHQHSHTAVVSTVHTSISTNHMSPSLVSSSKVSTSLVSAKQVLPSFSRAIQSPSSLASDNQVPSSLVSANQVPSFLVSANKVPSSSASAIQVLSSLVSTIKVPSSLVNAKQAPSTLLSANKVPSSFITTHKKSSSLVSANKVPSSLVSGCQVHSSSVSQNSLCSTSTDQESSGSMSRNQGPFSSKFRNQGPSVSINQGPSMSRNEGPSSSISVNKGSPSSMSKKQGSLSPMCIKQRISSSVSLNQGTSCSYITNPSLSLTTNHEPILSMTTNQEPTVTSFGQETLSSSNKETLQLFRSDLPEINPLPHSHSDDAESSSENSEDSCSSDENVVVEYKCKHCQSVFTHKSAFKKHLTSHKINSEALKENRKITCNVCRKKFKDLTGLQAHLLRRHVCFLHVTRAFCDSCELGSHICQMCHKSLPSALALSRHCYKALTCRLRYIDLVLQDFKKAVERPAKAVASSPEMPSKQSFVSKCAREVEKLAASPSSNTLSATSDICPDDSTEACSSTPVDHIKQEASKANSIQGHLKPCPGVCESCKKKYSDFSMHILNHKNCLRYYKNHKESRPEGNRFCFQCMRYFPSGFSSHKCEMYNIECSVCGQMFKSKRNMLIHVAHYHKKTLTTQSQLKPASTQDLTLSKHLCLVCSAAFPSIRLLMEHSQQHSDEVSLECGRCSMMFHHYNRYVSHQAVHMRMDKELGMPSTTTDSERTKSIRTISPSKLQGENIQKTCWDVVLKKDQSTAGSLPNSSTNSKSKEQSLTCLICLQSFPQQADKRNHLMESVYCRSVITYYLENKMFIHPSMFESQQLKPHQCQVCKQYITDTFTHLVQSDCFQEFEEGVLRHKNLSHNKGNKELAAKLGIRKSPNKSSVESHHSPAHSSSTDMTKEYPYNQQLYCLVCKKVFKTPQSVLEHSQVRHCKRMMSRKVFLSMGFKNGRHVCKLCNFSLRGYNGSKKYIINHMLKMHNSSQLLQFFRKKPPDTCSIGEKIVTSVAEKPNSSSGKFCCSLCGRVMGHLGKSSHLKKHIKLICINVGGKSKKPVNRLGLEKCPICKILTSNKSFPYHLASHTAVDIFKSISQSDSLKLSHCPHCESSFKSANFLEFHIRQAHTNRMNSPIAHSRNCAGSTSNEILSIKKNKDTRQLKISAATSEQASSSANRSHKCVCKLCTKRFSSFLTFRKHLKISHNIMVIKNVGDFMVESESEDSSEPEESCLLEACYLNDSRPEYRPGFTLRVVTVTEINCHICQMAVNALRYQEHLTDYHSWGRMFGCHYCDLKFPSQAILQKHKDQCAKDCICQLCQTSFFSVRGIKNHITKKHGISLSSYLSVKFPAAPLIAVKSNGQNIVSSDDIQKVSVCLCCYQEFHSVGEYLVHLMSHIKPCSVVLEKMSSCPDYPGESVPVECSSDDVNIKLEHSAFEESLLRLSDSSETDMKEDCDLEKRDSSFIELSSSSSNPNNIAERKHFLYLTAEDFSVAKKCKYDHLANVSNIDSSDIDGVNIENQLSSVGNIFISKSESELDESNPHTPHKDQAVPTGSTDTLEDESSWLEVVKRPNVTVAVSCSIFEEQDLHSTIRDNRPESLAPILSPNPLQALDGAALDKIITSNHSTLILDSEPKSLPPALSPSLPHSLEASSPGLGAIASTQTIVKEPRIITSNHSALILDSDLRKLETDYERQTVGLHFSPERNNVFPSVKGSYINAQMSVITNTLRDDCPKSSEDGDDHLVKTLENSSHKTDSAHRNVFSAFQGRLL